MPACNPHASGRRHAQGSNDLCAPGRRASSHSLSTAPTISRDQPSPSVPTLLTAPLVPLEGARQQSVPIYLSAAISARLHGNSKARSLQ